MVVGEHEITLIHLILYALLLVLGVFSEVYNQVKVVFNFGIELDKEDQLVD